MRTSHSLIVLYAASLSFSQTAHCQITNGLSSARHHQAQSGVRQDHVVRTSHACLPACLDTDELAIATQPLYML